MCFKKGDEDCAEITAVISHNYELLYFDFVLTS